MEASAQVAAMGQSYPLPRGVIRCRFIFSGKNDEPTPDFPILSISYLSRFPPPKPCFRFTVGLTLAKLRAWLDPGGSNFPAQSTT